MIYQIPSVNNVNIDLSAVLSGIAVILVTVGLKSGALLRKQVQEIRTILLGAEGSDTPSGLLHEVSGLRRERHDLGNWRSGMDNRVEDLEDSNKKLNDRVDALWQRRRPA